MRSDPRPAANFGRAASERVTGHDADNHGLWVSAIRHLDAALDIFDRLGAGGLRSASQAESARVHAKQMLRAIRKGVLDPSDPHLVCRRADAPIDATSTR